MMLHLCRNGGRSVSRLVPASTTSSSCWLSSTPPAASSQPDLEKKGGLYESLFGPSSNIAKPNTNRYGTGT